MLKHNKIMKIRMIEALNNYRLEKGLSQVKLGKILGVSHMTISNWFKGKFSPNDIWTYRIRKFLKRGDMDMKDDKVYLEHILEETKFVTGETREIDFDGFMKDEKLKRAVVRSIEIIGEATKQLSNETTTKYADQVNWSEIAKMRDKVIHHYAGVNWKIVWDTVENDIPALKKVTEKALGRSRGGGMTL